MSKFNNPDRALAPPRPPPAPSRPPPAAPYLPPPEARPSPVSTLNPLSAIENAPGEESRLVSVGFVVYCLFMISIVINDWAYLLFGGKGYISAAMVLLTPAIWLASGNALRGVRNKIGGLWILLLVCMVASIPFSVWKGNSVMMLIGYLARSYCYFFYVTAFVTSLKSCRRLMLVNIFLAVLMLMSCVFFGYSNMSSDGRFQVRGSMFMGNSNDLALQLTIGMTEFAFLFYLKGFSKKVLGLAGILACLFYMLKTGSRGCLLALFVAILAAFILSKQKFKMMLMFAPVIVVALLLIPQSSASRLLLIFHSSSAPVSSGSEASAMESQAERQELLKKSVMLTLQHPLFGVGVGQFVIAVIGEAAKTGKWAAALGTHNSYTQISSECGIPALIIYLAIIGVCANRSYRLYQLAARHAQYCEVEGLAFSLFLATLVYAVATFFFHIAYSGLLPMISGNIMALYAIAYPAMTARLDQRQGNVPSRYASPVAVST